MSETGGDSTDSGEYSVTYVERHQTVDEELAREMVRLVKEDAVKPWTLVKRTVESVDDDVESEFVRSEVLKPLMLEGVLNVNADGDVCMYEGERLESIV